MAYLLGNAQVITRYDPEACYNCYIMPGTNPTYILSREQQIKVLGSLTPANVSCTPGFAGKSTLFPRSDTPIWEL